MQASFEALNLSKRHDIIMNKLVGLSYDINLVIFNTISDIKLLKIMS